MTDARIERLLVSVGAEWEFHETFDLSTINLEKSRLNQARMIKAIDEDRIVKYEEAWRRGDVFPPILLHRTSASKQTHTIDSGNHRTLSAINVGKTTIPAYELIKPTEKQISFLIYADNAIHGLPLTGEEEDKTILFLSTLGYSIKQVGVGAGVTESRVRAVLDAEKQRVRTERLGISKEWSGLGATVKSRLWPIKNDPVFSDAVILAKDQLLNTFEITDLKKAIEAQAEQGKQIEAIAGFRQTLSMARAAKEPNAPAGPSIADLANTHIGGILRHVGYIDQLDPVALRSAILESQAAKLKEGFVKARMAMVEVLPKVETLIGTIPSDG